MPRYEYRCSSCHTVKEMARKVEDRDEKVECECGEEMERGVSETSFRLEGGGWTPKFGG